MADDVIEFEKVLDLACRSKFIMVDKRISDILKCIASNERIFETIKGTLKDFDFAKELKIATSIDGHFSMPNDDVRAVALCFCIFNAIDDKKIEITQLLAKNFTSDDPYAKFCDQVFLRFKVSTMAILGEEKQDFVVQTKSTDVSKELLDRALYLANQLDEYVKNSGKIYYECLLRSIKMADKMFVGVFFDLLRKNVSKKGKTLVKEIASVIEVIEKQ